VTLQSDRVVHDDYSQAVEAYFESGYTDGMPVIPPTPEAVESMLAAGNLAGAEVLGEVPTRNVTVTAEKAAVNAVMAGCKVSIFRWSWRPCEPSSSHSPTAIPRRRHLPVRLTL
jgi:hypothetical protein